MHCRTHGITPTIQAGKNQQKSSKLLRGDLLILWPVLSLACVGNAIFPGNKAWVLGGELPSKKDWTPHAIHPRQERPCLRLWEELSLLF